jgi:hypothetical protein
MPCSCNKACNKACFTLLARAREQAHAAQTLIMQRWSCSTRPCGIQVLATLSHERASGSPHAHYSVMLSSTRPLCLWKPACSLLRDAEQYTAFVHLILKGYPEPTGTKGFCIAKGRAIRVAHPWHCALSDSMIRVPKMSEQVVHKRLYILFLGKWRM